MKKVKYALYNKITYPIISILLLGIFKNFCHFNSISSACTFFAIINILLFLYGLLIWYKEYKTFNSPCIYFVLACFLCWYGQIIVRGFNLLPNSLIEIDLFDVNSFINTGSFLTAGFNLLFSGIIIFYKNNKLDIDYSKTQIENKNLKIALTFVSLLLIILGIYGHYSELIKNIIQVIKYGYASLYDNKQPTSGLINILTNFKMFFWPGCLMLMISNKNNNKIYKFILFIACLDVVLCMLSGARSDALSLILTLFWLTYSEFKHLNFKKLLMYCLFVLVGIKLFNVINDFRISDDKSIKLFLSLLVSTNSNAIVDFLSEFGFNIFSLHHTMLLIPSTKPYAYGYTYFASIMAVVPSLLMGGYSFSKKAALADWLKNTLNMNYGPGFSILAESYYNFGYFGIVCMFFIGGVIGTVMKNVNNGDKRIVKVIIITILFYSNIFIARDTFLMVFRKATYTIIFPLILAFLIKKVLDSKTLSSHI